MPINDIRLFRQLKADVVYLQVTLCDPHLSA